MPQEREESCNVHAKHGGPTCCYEWDPLAEDLPRRKETLLLYPPARALLLANGLGIAINGTDGKSPGPYCS